MDTPILGLVPRGIARLVLLLALAAPLACGDDDGGVQPPPGPSVRGTVTMIGTGAPMPDVQVILIDPVSLVPRSRTARTDSAGVYEIAERVPAGTYALLLFADSTAVFDRARPYLAVEDGLTTVHDVRMVDSELWRQHPPFIDGVVLNDATGAPVPGAWIDSGMWGWQGVDIRLPQMGITTSEMAVTDGEGRFRGTASVVTNQQGEHTGLFPVNVAADGFEPTTLVGRGDDLEGFGPALPLPAAGSDSVLRVTIRLSPLGADGAGPHGIGSITGTVIDAGGRPVGGVAVAASLVRSAFPDTFPPGRQRAPVPSRTAFTDAAGRFTITRLSPGDYGIQPAFLIGDGYVQETSGIDEAEGSGNVPLHPLALLDTDAGRVGLRRGVVQALAVVRILPGSGRGPSPGPQVGASRRVLLCARRAHPLVRRGLRRHRNAARDRAGRDLRGSGDLHGAVRRPRRERRRPRPVPCLLAPDDGGVCSPAARQRSLISGLYPAASVQQPRVGGHCSAAPDIGIRRSSPPTAGVLLGVDREPRSIPQVPLCSQGRCRTGIEERHGRHGVGQLIVQVIAVVR